MEAVGIDSSLNHTGFATVGESLVPYVTTFPTSSMDGSHEDFDRRILYITGQVVRHSPKLTLTVIEKPIVPRHGGAGDVIERAWLYGFIVNQMMRRGPVVVVHPMTRAKYASGKGNAKKPEVLAAVRDTYPDLVIADDNEADALALCAMGARFLGHPIDGEPSAAQLEAMHSVRWRPNLKEKK